MTEETPDEIYPGNEYYIPDTPRPPKDWTEWHKEWDTDWDAIDRAHSRRQVLNALWLVAIILALELLKTWLQAR